MYPNNNVFYSKWKIKGLRPVPGVPVMSMFGSLRVEALPISSTQALRLRGALRFLRPPMLPVVALLYRRLVADLLCNTRECLEFQMTSKSKRAISNLIHSDVLHSLAWHGRPAGSCYSVRPRPRVADTVKIR